MESFANLSKPIKAKGHHILTDIELARMHESIDGTDELIQKLHKKFYKIIPHNNNHPLLTESQIYVKKALLIASIKGY